MPTFSGALLSSTNEEEDEAWLYTNIFPTPVWCEDKNLAMDDWVQKCHVVRSHRQAKMSLKQGEPMILHFYCESAIKLA